MPEISMAEAMGIKPKKAVVAKKTTTKKTVKKAK